MSETKLTAQKFRWMYARIFFSFALLVSVVFLGAQLVVAFTGPTTSPGQGGGVVEYNAVSGSVGIGVTPLDGSPSKLMIGPTGSQAYGLEVRRTSGAVILTTSDVLGVIVATSTANATTTLYGNLIVIGTISGALGNITVDAGSVTPNVFNINVASGTGDYAFPSKLGVGTSTTASIPHKLSVYGSAYVSSTLFVGTTVLPPGGSNVSIHTTGSIIVPSYTTASAPILSFKDDLDTGIYHSGSNEVAFTGSGYKMASFRWRGGAGGSAILDFPQGGTEGDAAVMIGTNAGGGGGLYSPGAGILALVTGAVDNSIERMRLVSSTGVGIHTQTPQYTLDVNGHMRLMPTSTVPAASNGAMFYNATEDKLKCYEGGWWNCTGAGGSAAGAPNASDCDTDAERGRLFIETTNNYLYVCNGAVRGWDYVALTN